MLSLFGSRQRGPAEGSVCRALWVSSHGFPLQTDNIFFQSCTSVYPQGFLNPLHWNENCWCVCRATCTPLQHPLSKKDLWFCHWSAVSPGNDVTHTWVEVEALHFWLGQTAPRDVSTARACRIQDVDGRLNIAFSLFQPSQIDLPWAIQWCHIGQINALSSAFFNVRDYRAFLREGRGKFLLPPPPHAHAKHNLSQSFNKFLCILQASFCS